MYLAVWMATLMALMLFYRKYVYDTSHWKEDEKTGTKVWVQGGIKYWSCLRGGESMRSPHTWFQILVSPEGILFVLLFSTTLTDLALAVHFLREHKWLTPDGAFGHEDELSKPEWQIPEWIRWFSITSPFVMIVTCLIILVHILQHYAKVKSLGEKQMSEYRDKSLQVIMLPMVYSIMAFKSVLRMWKCFMNDFEHTGHFSVFEKDLGGNFSVNVEIQMELYETNFRTADLYEAWALYCFGKLTLLWLEHSTREGLTGDIRHRVEALMRVLRDVTAVGVAGFVVCAVVSALVAFYKPIMDMTRNSAAALNATGAEATLMAPSPFRNGFMDGLGFFGSSIAIYNLLKIEMAKDLHPYLAAFHPAWKFWGTKILVSIAYFQSIILEVINALTGWYAEQQVNLIYSTLIIYELVGIAILHYAPALSAWHPDGQWFQTVEEWDEVEKERAAKEAELAGHSYYGSTDKTEA
eukprot:Hpha_TRINITY_DN15705_c2_g5::TRINITY_DN15705_c2_g5_i1::g.42076::m.42076